MLASEHSPRAQLEKPEFILICLRQQWVGYTLKYTAIISFDILSGTAIKFADFSRN